jgi:hypothetical protein
MAQSAKATKNVLFILFHLPCKIRDWVKPSTPPDIQLPSFGIGALHRSVHICIRGALETILPHTVALDELVKKAPICLVFYAFPRGRNACTTMMLKVVFLFIKVNILGVRKMKLVSNKEDI